MRKEHPYMATGRENIQILYEDNHLLALNKPPGLATQPSSMHGESLEDYARQWIRAAKDKKGNVFVHAVHRLDRPTSGVVLFAKTSKALSRMNEQQRARRVRKVYHAVVTSHPPEREGVLTHVLRHSRMRAVVSHPQTPGARQCTLGYRVLGKRKDLFLVEIELSTGRYHQIRAQFAACGCPVLGDTAYGGRPLRDYPGIALHHAVMEFIHPTVHATTRIQAPYPASWPFRGDADTSVRRRRHP